MTRSIVFERTVEPVAELLQIQLEGALQIIAALVLTPEEGKAICEARMDDCQPNARWINAMRADLQSEEWHEALVDVLKRQGWGTNTHPGFPLASMERAPPATRKIDEAYKALEVMLQAHADGQGAEIKEETAPRLSGLDLWQSYWAGKLVDAGHDHEIAYWVMKNEGSALAGLAAIERIMRPVRAKEREAKEKG